MKVANIRIDGSADIDESSSINNALIGKNTKISKRCSIFGSENCILEIGSDSYVGMNAFLNGFRAKLVIGSNVSIAQNVCIMTDSGPNASSEMQKFFPIEIGQVYIGDHCWIGANAVILPNVRLGKFCVVAANAVVKDSFDDYSVIGGSPGRLIRKLKTNNIL